jgi:Phytanoyl-CoA dioxygenase (PhyH)
MKVNAILESMELVYPEMEAGDAIFFHSNLLHRADANFSSQSRWSLISCYSAQSNLAKNAPFTSWHTPVSIVPNEAILRGVEKPLVMMY